MTTALDAPPQTLDADERRFVDAIREHGWFMTWVFGDDEGPGFAYTTGFWIAARQPELIVFSLKKDIAHEVFWNLFRNAQAGKTLAVGLRSDDVFVNLPVYAFEMGVERYPDYLGWSRWFYRGDDFPCRQIVWPDPNRLFPWENGFDPKFASQQRDLTEAGWTHSLAQ